MPASSDAIGCYRALVALETDATRYYGPEAVRPALLGPGDAEQMLAHLAADLRALLPDIAACSLIAAGALYDQTQILQPGYPVFDALEATPRPSRDDRGDAAFRPALVSIGARKGTMPVAALQPAADIPLGLLQLLPVVIHGPAGRVEELGQAMEYRFLEEGQVSAHTAAWLQTAFGVVLTHARFMTLTDLNAMLRMQLDHFGFLPLWELLDAALADRASALDVTSGTGQDWAWRDGAATTAFETFDYWARVGGGAGLSPGRMALAGAYGDRTRELRQYLTLLRAHGVEVRFEKAGTGEPLETSFLCEESELDAAAGDATLTHHSFEDLGTVAITAVTPAGIRNYYPLRARGLNEIHRQLDPGASGEKRVAWPGTILYDEQRRCLRPDRNGHFDS